MSDDRAEEKRASASRRLVTGVDSNGDSFAEIDGPTRGFIDYGKAVISEIWIDAGGNPLNQQDLVSERQVLSPPAGGSVCRIFIMRPKGGFTVKLAESDKFSTGHEMETSEVSGPRWHTTKTIDYAFVLRGTIELLLDDGSHLLSAGDVVVQRATRHAWRNPGQTDCEIAFVLIDRSVAIG